MLTESEKRLIEAVVDSGLDEHVSMCLPEGMDDDQMKEMTEFIREKIRTHQKVTENDVVKKRLIILGVIEDDE